MKKVAAQSAIFLCRYRFALCAAIGLVTLLAAQQLAGLSVSNSLEIWYPQDDPELIRYRRFVKTYGSDEIVVVAVTSRDGAIFSSDDGLHQIAGLTDQLLDLDGVAAVTSLVTVPQSLANARGRLLSADGRTTALVVQTIAGPDSEARRPDLLRDIRQIVAAADLDAHLGGYGVVFNGLNEASTTGAATLVFYAHLLMVLLLGINFRRIVPVLATLVTVGVATVWTMGLYVATGHQLNMVTMVLPTLVLVIGIADCLHVVRSVAAQDQSLDRVSRVTAGLADVVGPCFLTSVTTAAGFLGLTASGLPVVQQLGWFGAAGMLSAFICSMVLVPAALSWRGAKPADRSSLADITAVRLCDFASRRAKSVVTIFALLAVVAGYGISLLSTDTDSIGYLKKTHPVRQDSDFIERKIGPYVPIEFTVTSDGNMLEADNLDRIWAWQQDATSLDKIGWSWSLISAFNLGDGELPSAAGMDRLRQDLDRMRSFSPGTVAAMLNGDKELRVSFGAPIMSAVAVQELIEEIKSRANFPAALELAPAGYSPLYTRIVDAIVTSQIRGFASAMVLIVVLLGLGMRSLRRVLLALPANAIPVGLTLGLMGLTGIPLDVASATIASVILGLVVDDTIHILRPTKGAGVRESIAVAARSSGGTLVMTTVILACGFLVLGLAEIRSIAWFGVLTSFAVAAAILTDLLLIPALARLFSRSTNHA